MHPKYAHLEVERRWLVDPAAVDALAKEEPIAIADRYIIGTRTRLRIMRRGEQAVYKLTRKYDCDDPISRPIVTAYLDPDEYKVFAALPAFALTKIRYKVILEGHAFSLDQFEGPLQGLWLSEIEFADISDLRALADPYWALRDVTNEPAYQGATLARLGIPE
ncbi:MAG: hypothetical protein ACKO1O_05775 [Erythrobacter sp.]